MTIVDASTSTLEIPGVDKAPTHLLVEISQLLRNQERLIEAVERLFRQQTDQSQKIAWSSMSDQPRLAPIINFDIEHFWN
jgi:hypothetical protein